MLDQLISELRTGRCSAFGLVFACTKGSVAFHWRNYFQNQTGSFEDYSLQKHTQTVPFIILV